MGEVNPPQSVSEVGPTALKLKTFDCGHDSLNHWLVRRAIKNDALGASRTFIVTYEKEKSLYVGGYYALATGAVYHNTVSKKQLKHNMPNPIPMVLLARLATDKQWQGKGIGVGMLKDAITRTLASAKNIGIKGLFVHALTEDASRFYKYHGFRESPIAPLQLMISLKDAEAILAHNKASKAVVVV